MEQVGSPRDVYERPATEFVAEFVGASNRIPATIVEGESDGVYRAELEGVGQVRVTGVPGLVRDQAASAIVRPEAISPGPVPAGHVGVSARIVDLAYLGHQISCLAESEGGPQIAVSVHEARAPVAVGETHQLSWPLSAVWLVARDDTAAQAAT
jgi:ABC-type Fe3+/spermidine/putrescine transport system ATPase subunit